jgi:DNA repair protein RadC
MEGPTEHLSIRQWAADERPRERFRTQGPQSVSDAELLAILIRTGSTNRSALDIARELLRTANNDLGQLGRLSVAEIMQRKGLGEAKAVTIAAALELGRRRKEHRASKRPQICDSAMAYEELRPHLADLPHEEFWLLLLDRGMSVLDKCRIGQGGFHQTVVDPRVVFKHALDHRATGLILAHNHPSGRTEPSPEDLTLTTKLRDAGKLLDILVQDHLIITAGGYYSLADHGRI